MNPTKILLGNNLVSTLVMPLSTLPPAPVEETGRGAGEPGRGVGQLITIRVQAPDDEDQEDREEEEDICRISVTQ